MGLFSVLAGSTEVFNEAVSHVRKIKPATLTLDADWDMVLDDGGILNVMGVAKFGYPEYEIFWTIGGKSIPAVTEDRECHEDFVNDCPDVKSKINRVVRKEDHNQMLVFSVKQTDDFGHESVKTKSLRIQINGQGTIFAWTAGKIAGLVIGILFILILIILLLLLLIRRRSKERRPVENRGMSAQINQGVSLEEVPEISHVQYLQIKDYPVVGVTHQQLQLLSKWDPYDSEPDRPLTFAYEGQGRPLSPAVSLSSLDSEPSHVDNLDLEFFENNLRVISDSRSGSSSTSTVKDGEFWMSDESQETSEDDNGFYSYSVQNGGLESWV